MRRCALGLATLAAALTLSCSNSKNPHPFTPQGSGGSGAGGATGAGGGSGHCTGTQRPSNDGFCYTSACNPSLDCSRATQQPVDDCCVLVSQPGEGPSPDLVRTTDTKKYADPSGTPPDVSCFDPAHYPSKPPPGGTSMTATLKGKVVAFANGCDLTGVKIEVFKVQRTGDPATDGDLGDPVGSPVITDSSSPVVDETVTACTDPRKDRAYSYPGVPMYTELVVKTSAATPSDLWSPLYTYNIYITESDPDYQNGVYTYDPEALASSDFQTIPNVAGISNITPGNGAIGGEVHDCGNIRLQNATVGVSEPARALVYFNASEDDPQPDASQSQIGTGRTALYAALDLAPGFVRVAASGILNGKLVSLGYFNVRVFPDSVTSLSLRGLRPFQLP